MNNTLYDVAIIGSGPGGLAAALYLLRSGRSVIMFESGMLGGQLAKCPYIENYPGFVGKGIDLVNNIFDNLTTYSNFTFETSEIQALDELGDYWHLHSEYDEIFYAKFIIVATGAHPIHLPVPGLDARNVHYCATCDGPLYTNKTVAVIGDGNSAMQYALELSTYCTLVYLIILFDHFFGEADLISRVYQKQSITVIPYFKTEEFRDGRTLISANGNEINVDGVFVAVGQVPSTSLLSGFGVCNDKGYVKTDTKMRALHNLYVVGDCREKDVRQVLTAMSDGCIAAVNINKQL